MWFVVEELLSANFSIIDTTLHICRYDIAYFIVNIQMRFIHFFYPLGHLFLGQLLLFQMRQNTIII